MDYVIPKPVWQGMDVYIIGGGNSLRDFNWGLLRSCKTIGCNDAYTLGFDICKICLFGDAKWYNSHAEALKKYVGSIYCGEPKLFNKNLPNKIQHIRRFASGLQTNGVGWNGNTGFMAINLALLLGAKTIYLLGFDMKRVHNKSNWHENNLDKNVDSVYQKFINWSSFVERDWKAKFRNVGIFNITDDSDLNIFPKIGTKEFWRQKATG
jgi:hypothetical protein